MDNWAENNQKNSFKTVLSDLLANSSSHGLPNIHRSKRLVSKLFWAVLFFTGIGVFCWQVSELAQTFRDRDVTVTLKMQFNNTIDFPAVTICNTNPVKMSSLHMDNDMNAEFKNPKNPYSANNNQDMDETNNGNAYGNSENEQESDEDQSSTDFADSIGPSNTPGGGPNNRRRRALHTSTEESTTSGILTTDIDESDVAEESTTPVSNTVHVTTFDVSGSTETVTTLMSSTSNETTTNDTSLFDWDDQMLQSDFYQGMDWAFEQQKSLRRHMAKKNESERQQMGHDIKDMLVDCIWKGYPCSPVNFTSLPNSAYGNCYVFNSGKDGSSLKTNRPGLTYGLTLELYIAQHEYLTDITETAGIRVAITPQNIFPFAEDNGIAVSPGFATEIGMRLVEIERQPAPYGECVEMNGDVVDRYSNNVYIKRFGVNYSVQSCEKSCYQDQLISNCTCSDPDFPTPTEAVEAGIEPCNILANNKDKLCYNYINLKFDSDELECDCPQPCQEKSYISSMSFAKWPAENYKDTMHKKLENRLPKARHTHDINAWTQNNVVRLQIFFEELNYQSIKESPAYTEFDLLSDIGGQLGLWIGVSMITVFEIVEFLAAILTLLTRRFLSSSPVTSRSVTPIQKIKLTPAEDMQYGL
ncbi:epithelial sodium channel subunit beta-like [Glandiceps talaboti]